MLRLGHASVHIPAVLFIAGRLHRAHVLVSDAHDAPWGHVLDHWPACRLCVGGCKGLQKVSREEGQLNDC